MHVFKCIFKNQIYIDTYNGMRTKSQGKEGNLIKGSKGTAETEKLCTNGIMIAMSWEIGLT